MIGVLAVDPCYDRQTQAAHTFREHHIFDKFSSRYPMFKLVHLEREQATREAVINVIEDPQYNIKFLTAAGHGSTNVYRGYKGEVIFKDSDRLEYLNGITVHLLSCYTAPGLGLSMINAGAKAFWGYVGKFDYSYDINQGSSNMLNAPNELIEDSSLEAIFLSDSLIVRGILARRSPREIYDAVRTHVDFSSPQVDYHSRRALIDNQAHLVCPAIVWGSIDSTL